MKDKTEKMRQIKDEVVAFKTSPLYEYRVEAGNLPVIGEGSHEAAIMFVGEAPGKNEAATGRPFCGASGRILDDLLESAGIERKDVYVTNILKDRPPANRDPLPAEIAMYSTFLQRQIDIIKPKVIATLGRFSSGHIMEMFGLADVLGPISTIHGKVFNTTTSFGELKVVPLYHPAVAVYSPSKKDELKKDFAILKQFYK